MPAALVGGVRAVAVLADGRVVTGGTGHRVRVWDVVTRAEFTRIACPVFAFATAPFSSVGHCHLVVAHGGSVQTKKGSGPGGNPGALGLLLKTDDIAGTYR